ncbi:MAG: sulfotransferase family protein [Ktedonobacteraceae bacterium]
MADQPIAREKGGMKVIGAGFGRTGTLSLKTALEELGFAPCYHMVALFNNPDDVDQWEAATRGEVVDWEAFLADYQATVDWPGCAFYKELMLVYPEAKVLLTVRDFDKWYESVQATIYETSRRFAQMRKAPVRSFFIGRLFPAGRMGVVRLINNLIWEKTFGGNFDDKTHALAVFDQHIEEVKRLVPADRLLVYNVKEGWGPLCAFLGVAVPMDKPFPHLNERAGFAGNRFRQRERRRRVNVLLTAVSVLAVLVFLLLRRVSRR